MTLQPQTLQLYSPWNSPGQNTEVGNLSLLQQIFPTPKLNPGLPQCRQILYQLSHKGSPRILEWVTYPFSSRDSQPPESNPGLLYCRWIFHQLSYQQSLLLVCPNPLWRRRQWKPTPVFLPGKSHGRRSLVGCSPWGR